MRFLAIMLVLLSLVLANSYGAGLEILCKVGNKRPVGDPLRDYDWRDGQVIDIRPGGYFIQDGGKINGEMTCKHFVVIQCPNVDFWQLTGAKTWADLKTPTAKWLAVKQYSSAAHDGKYPWESGYTEPIDASPARWRDWFVDFKKLLNDGLITQAIYDSIYDAKIDHLPIVLNGPQILKNILQNENSGTRLPAPEHIGTIDAGGTYTVGTGQTYATWSAAITDLPADLGAMTTPGDIIFKGNTTEEITESTAMTISSDTDIYTITLTVDDAHVHNGGAYGNGHRVALTTYDRFAVDETTGGTTNNVIFEKMAVNASGTANYAWYPIDGGDTGHIICQRCVFKGDVNSRDAIIADYRCSNGIIRNNSIYGFTEASYGRGIQVYAEGLTPAFDIYNNTIAKCRIGIAETSVSPVGTVNVDNNLFQGNTTDWSDPNSGLTSGGKNVSEDATSPDVAYRNLNCHDGNSCFTDYANNDFRLVAGGDELTTLDDGNDKSAIGAPEQFTDDIEGQTRVDWYIGCSEYISGAPPSFIPKVIWF